MERDFSISETWLEALGQLDPAVWSQLATVRRWLSPEDPVRRAIEDWLLDDESSAVDRRRRANAALIHAAGEASREPFAFDRLVIEWARRRTMRHRGESFGVLDRCVAIFERRLFDPRRIGCARLPRALLGLAIGYRADDRRVAGHHLEAARDLARARGHLEPPHGVEAPPEEGPTHREIRATLLELRIDLANAQGDHEWVARRLDDVATLLVDTPAQGRRAEMLWRVGRHALAIDRNDYAALVLERAAFELPDDIDLSLRLDILHLRAFAEASVGSFERAAFYLAEAEPLLGPWGHDLLDAQRHHLLGHLALREGDAEAAREHWTRSYRLSLSHGHQLDAIQTLASLLRLLRSKATSPGARDEEIRQLLEELL